MTALLIRDPNLFFYVITLPEQLWAGHVQILHTIHDIGVYTLTVLVGMHVGAGVLHVFKKDGVVEMMTREQAPPEHPALSAFVDCGRYVMGCNSSLPLRSKRRTAEMKTPFTPFAIALAFGIGLCASIDFSEPGGTERAIGLGVTGASAQTIHGEARRTARRTSRRTTRRQNYINTLPGGCVRRGAYYYCGGIYYQPVLQGGTTVYIVVNP